MSTSRDQSQTGSESSGVVIVFRLTSSLQPITGIHSLGSGGFDASITGIVL